jgi:NAD(P)-dependent dehydrogenase (short-subunit alcohol dehydrogenase family)
VVTGGGTGLGRAIARRLAAEGYRVLACGRREEPLRSLAAETGDALRWVRADVTVAADVEGVGDAALDAWGRVDAWVNNAGAMERGTLPEAAPEHLRRLMEVNVTGTFLGCRTAVALMRRNPGGSIVNVSSYLANHAGASGTLPAYCASKGAVSALTRSLAVFHGPEGIRVNAVCPAMVPTELNASVWENAPDREVRLRELGERYPLRRVGTPEDVAGAVWFLASEDAAWITGHELVVDGGISAV